MEITYRYKYIGYNITREIKRLGRFLFVFFFPFALRCIYSDLRVEPLRRNSTFYEKIRLIAAVPGIFRTLINDTTPYFHTQNYLFTVSSQIRKKNFWLLSPLHFHGLFAAVSNYFRQTLCIRIYIREVKFTLCVNSTRNINTEEKHQRHFVRPDTLWHDSLCAAGRISFEMNYKSYFEII